MLRKYHMHTIMNCIFLETPVVIISTSVFVDILVYWYSILCRNLKRRVVQIYNFHPHDEQTYVFNVVAVER